MPFRTALSGLNAASADLRVTGNNIANSGTTGFKESRAQFSDVFARSQGGVSSTAIGSGVRLSSVTQQFSQGNIDFTGNSLDLAISGDGFFTVKDAAGAAFYTRAGAFGVDKNDFVVNGEGQFLQIYPGEGSGNGATVPLRLDTSAAPPSATETVQARLNLPAGAEPPEDGGFNYSTSVTVYDSLGHAHTATLQFEKLEETLDWRVSVSINGGEAQSLEPDAGLLSFDDQGRLGDGAGVFELADFNFENGSAASTIAFDLGSATQFGGSFSVTSLSQDGFTTGTLSGIDIDSGGVVFARFTNGDARSLGTVALASFANPQGLQQLGNNLWAQTSASGEAIEGRAGDGNVGLIQSGGLEASNVDIAQQLVNLITAQRNFQANSQVISTADTITQTIINIRR